MTLLGRSGWSIGFYLLKNNLFTSLSINDLFYNTLVTFYPYFSGRPAYDYDLLKRVVRV